MDKNKITTLKIGDIIVWTGDKPDKFEIINVFKGNPPSSYGYEYEDWDFRIKSLSDNHTELISGSEMINIHFIYG